MGGTGRRGRMTKAYIAIFLIQDRTYLSLPILEWEMHCSVTECASYFKTCPSYFCCNVKAAWRGFERSTIKWRYANRMNSVAILHTRPARTLDEQPWTDCQRQVSVRQKQFWVITKLRREWKPVNLSLNSITGAPEHSVLLMKGFSGNGTGS